MTLHAEGLEAVAGAGWSYVQGAVVELCEGDGGVGGEDADSVGCVGLPAGAFGLGEGPFGGRG